MKKSLTSTWSWISRRRQTEIISKYVDHVEKVLETVEHTYRMLVAYSKGNADKAREEYNNVFNAERSADEVKRKIIDELSSELFHPIDREELIRLILTTDDIAAYAKAASRRLLLVVDKRLDEKIVEKLLAMAEKIVYATKILKNAVLELLKNPRNSLKLADKVEKLEEEVDDLRMEALELVLEYCDQTKPSLCIIAKELVDSLENASDRCEDAGDVIRSIALLLI